LDEAKANSDHIRRIELRSLSLQARDNVLHRVLPFVLVLMFLCASTILAIFANAVVGGASLVATLAAVVIAYLKDSGRK
jgi:energy-coupling factor transporter transmembrane protein EcfT